MALITSEQKNKLSYVAVSSPHGYCKAYDTLAKYTTSDKGYVLPGGKKPADTMQLPDDAGFWRAYL